MLQYIFGKTSKKYLKNKLTETINFVVFDTKFKVLNLQTVQRRCVQYNKYIFFYSIFKSSNQNNFIKE